MPDLDLDALAAVAEAATPGPWSIEKTSSHMDPETWGLEIERWRGYINLVSLGEDEATATHIATFDPSTALALTAEARKAGRLRREVAALADEWDAGLAAATTEGPCRESVHAAVGLAVSELRALIGGER